MIGKYANYNVSLRFTGACKVIASDRPDRLIKIGVGTWLLKLGPPLFLLFDKRIS